MDGRRFDDPARLFAAPISRRHVLTGVAAALAGLPTAGLRRATARTRAQPEPTTGHPRLWVTAGDLPRLRSWATDANPLYRDGLAVLAAEAMADVDAGRVPAEDAGSRSWDEYPTESYAELFAFMSLISPDETAREDYAQRARTLLMHVMNEAAKGQADDQPFRDPEFATADRSRWWGESFALTVDWIYPVLTPEEKATIHQVFLRWAAEIEADGYPPRPPAGTVNDPALLLDPVAVRWSGNNYFTANMRNLGLIALALDAEDDPGGELGAYLEAAVGTRLFMHDHLLRTDARGGLAPEGFGYGPEAMGNVSQLLFALQTAGQNDQATWGPQVTFDGNAFWDDMIPAMLHSLSPAPVIVPGYEYLGPVYQPAWYGDGETYWAEDFITVFGPLGVSDQLTGNAKRLEAIRWIQTHLAPGGADQLIPERVADPESHYEAILYFLLFDPAAKAPQDPRLGLPLVHFAPGLGRLLVRTRWEADAAWFTYALGWNTIDHQHGTGNQFEFYRNGEWLTKGLVGYGTNADSSDTDKYSFLSSEYHNTLALENDRPPGTDDLRWLMLWERGSQWLYVPDNPQLVALRATDGYVYALGDATNLYNSADGGSTDILHASRSIVWLPPDVIVVYDRATSKTDGRFKRFWLNLPAEGAVEGNRTTMTTASGQQLVVTTLAPTDAVPTVQPLDVREEDMAVGEPMRYRLRVEAPGGPRDVRFFHVLQGADPGAAVDDAVLVESDDGAFAGAVVGATAVLVPVDIGVESAEVRYTVPGATTAHLITGLAPGAGYDVTTQPSDGDLLVTVRPGTTAHADDGGVLVWGALADAGQGATASPAPASPQATSAP